MLNFDSCVNSLKSGIFAFEELEMFIFGFQKKTNTTYHSFCQTSNLIKPYLPISAFKSSKIVSFAEDATGYFESSGTTMQNTSRHYFRTKELYHQVSLKIFEDQFGKITDLVILALLPNYLEKSRSSLVDMVTMLMEKSNNDQGGFYLYNFEELATKIKLLKQSNQKVILFGVTFALLDFLEQIGPIDAPHLTVIETGGMKGRKKEIIREELHAILSQGFKGATISSEYGMTELFSQAYLQSDGWFKPGYTMQVFTTEINDPYTREKFGKTGVINVTDLANVDSCSFITTEDLGIVREDGCFKVMGRLDNSDMRGCNLMIE